MKSKQILLVVLCVILAYGCNADKYRNISKSDLYEGFVTPPQSARPRVWWHWMDGNISKDGIQKDILWMYRSGIGGFHQFDAGTRMRQIVDERLIYMHDDWKDAFQYAIELADSLGMEVTVASSPGWSNTGGPWVTEENAMKKLTWREMLIEGGQTIDLKLPNPYKTVGYFQNFSDGNQKNGYNPDSEQDNYYQDIAVIAVKIPTDDRLLNATVRSSGGNFTVEQLSNGSLGDAAVLPSHPSGYAWIEYSFDTPQTVKAVTVSDGQTRYQYYCAPAPITKWFEMSNDGIQWEQVCEVPHGGSLQQTISFPAVSAKKFRMRFANSEQPGTYVSEFKLYSTTKINHAEEKAGFATPFDMMENITPASDNQPRLADVVDLTDITSTDGTLSWDVPEGLWKVYRFGCSLTGKKNHPAPEEATGLEVDKLNGDAVREYLNTYLDMYNDASGGMLGERGVHCILIDSYEAGWETWTKDLAIEFKNRCGYSPIPWLPVLTGQIMESTERSEQFLFDWRSTIGALIGENLYGVTQQVASEHGMECYFEGHENGRLYLVDGMDAKKHASIPMAAFWMNDKTRLTRFHGSDVSMAQCDIKESASVAHIYGQNLVAAESFTTDGRKNTAYSFYPGNLKPLADMALACGLNRFVIHESAHQPSDTAKPGMGLIIYGQWFNRHETWAEQAKAWTDYLARSSYMLQQGRFVADVLYYYGEDNCINGLFEPQFPVIPDGYGFDYASPSVILEQVSAKNGLVTTPSGMSYRLLALDKNARAMSLSILRKIAELVKAGVTISGQKPEYEPTLNGDKAEFDSLVADIWETGRPNVLTGASVEEALRTLGVQPDFNAEDMTDLKFVHRSLKNTEIYWISNDTDHERQVSATFRVSGLKPEIWHPETGLVEAVSYVIKDEETEVDFNMVSHDAVFIVFSGKPESVEVRLPEVKETLLCEVNTPWEVSFSPNKSLTMDKLVSYTEFDDPDIKYFSGTATYNNSLNIPAEALTQGRLKLKLGQVDCIAEIAVNNKPAGTLWKTPYDIDITDYVREGSNHIEVKVTNLWVNRLIGDAQPDCPNPTTWTSVKFFNANSPLLSSGLIGPVELYMVR